MKYHLARDGDKLGEYSDLEISAGLRRGEFRATDLCWSAGMNDWEPLGERFPPPEPAAGSEDEAELRWSAVPEAEGPELASRWLRFLAWWVDWMVIQGIWLVIWMRAGIFDYMLKNKELPPQELYSALYDHLQREVESRPQDFQMPFSVFLLIIAVNISMLAIRGQTLGKLIAGIRIVRFQSAAPAGFGSAVLMRSGLMFLIYSIPMVNVGIWVVNTLCIFRADRRCLHDLIADTMVIKQR